jgi:hypothetical protein
VPGTASAKDGGGTAVHLVPEYSIGVVGGLLLGYGGGRTGEQAQVSCPTAAQTNAAAAAVFAARGTCTQAIKTCRKSLHIINKIKSVDRTI